MELVDIENMVLDDIANNLPLNPPLTDDGDLSVIEMHPDLTKFELDYVYKKYLKIGGTMRKE